MKIISDMLRGRRRTLFVGLCCFGAASAAADGSQQTSLEQWADAQFEPALAQRRYSGLVMSVVKDGAVVFAKGYGAADWAQRTPVDPDRTLFRIGSTSKVFVGMAIAQLLERGMISSLQDPANKYLKRIQLPRAFGKDITVQHLLTHRAGFEDKAFGLGTSVPLAMQADADEIRRAMPKIVREPGTFSVYSNFSTALLGTIVEDVTGQPLAAYYKQNLFGPMGMQRSYVNYELAPAADLGVPYAFLPDGSAQRVPYVPMRPFIAPAGGINATAADMAKFMIAHLEGEGAGHSAVLSPQMFQLMHTRTTGNHPMVSGFGMIFIVDSWNGHPVIEHGGGWPGFQTIMMMFPQQRLGVFISIMGGEPAIGLGKQLRRSFGETPPAVAPQIPVGRHLSATYLREALLTHLFGSYVPPKGDSPQVASAPALEEYAGAYWRERRSYTSLEAFFSLLNAGREVAQVRPAGDGTLRIGEVGGFRPIAPGVFWNEKAASTDADPESVQLFAFTTKSGQSSDFAPQLSVDVWKRSSAFWNPLSLGQLAAWMFLLTATGLACLAWPGADRVSRVTRWLPAILLVLLLAIPLMLLAGYEDGDGVPYALLMARPARFIGLAVLGNLVALTTLMMLFTTWRAWRNDFWGTGGRGVARRIHYSALTVAAITLAIVLSFFNLVGWHLP
jgi:CubicO group peptidase (beta-lactamase class C family)